LAIEVRVAVYNAAGELVKEILVTKTLTTVDSITGQSDTLINAVGDVVDLYWKGAWIGSWDGTNTDGKAVNNGEYFVKVDSIDPYGVTKTVTMDVTVNRRVERLDITIYNAAGEAVRHLTSVEAADLGPNAVSVALSTDVIQPGGLVSGVPSTLTISLPNGTTAVWDGRSDTGDSVADGQYYVEVRSEGNGGGGTVVVKNVAVLGSNPGNRVTARPNVLTSSMPTVAFVGPVGTTVKVVVYTAAGEKASTAWGISGVGTVSWDSTGSASGVYLAVASTYDSSGKFLNRNVIKLIVR
jgi:flagellar hook assembly protein FlgD